MNKIIYPTEVLQVTIERVDDKGYGHARYVHAPDKGSNGKHLKMYIPHTVSGDLVEVTIENAKGRGKATVNFDKLIKAGPSRNLDMPINTIQAGGTPLIFYEL